MQRKNRYCCELHIDKGFDDFLVENNTFPHMNECLTMKCDYCENDATYELVIPEIYGILE